MLQYLFDENVDPAYVIQIRRRQPDLFVLAIGELAAPAWGTLDPEILCWKPRAGRANGYTSQCRISRTKNQDTLPQIGGETLNSEVDRSQKQR